MLRRFSINFAVFSMLADMLVVGCSLWLAAVVRPALNTWPYIEVMSTPVRLPLTLYVVFPLVFLVVLSGFAIYDGRKFLRIVDEFAALSLAIVVASISVAGVLYLSFRDVSRALFLVFLLFSFASLFLWRGIARLIFRNHKDWPDETRLAVIVGKGPLREKVQERIEGMQSENLKLVGVISDESGGGEINVDSIERLVVDSMATDVIIALPHSRYDCLRAIVGGLEDLPVHVWVALGFFDLALYQTALEDFAGIPMLDLRALALSDVQRLIKRAFDILIGGLALLLALPLITLSALAILLEDGRPVLFRQQRAGENGRTFTMFKFRTMVKDAEQMRHLVEHRDEAGNLIHKTKDDPRVTRVGRFLRRYSLDELPQLINVLLGTMSLVGPRPELPYLVEQYQPWQRKRFVVPPGLTGWWQVNGRSERAMHLHTEDDLYYIQNYSFWLDILILIRTAWVVLIGRGSY
ncbi:MAG: sugar transferase [Anaerolineales bacterium]|nr:sugar transferase [Anaerolineales bacterium]